MKILDFFCHHMLLDFKKDILEVHEFCKKFDLGPYILHPDSEIRKIEYAHEVKKDKMAREWIIKNSKLLKNDTRSRLSKTKSRNIETPWSFL